jgi:VanZ family protein
MPQGQASITLGWDKLNHLFAFFVLLGLLDYAYPTLDLWRRKIVVLIFYAVAIELVQGVLPDREASLLDVLADIIGLAIFLMLRPTIKTFLQEKLKVI